MLGLKDPAFENSPSRPHFVCFSTVTVGCGRRQTIRKMSSDRRKTASWGKAGRNGGDLWSWPKDQQYFPQKDGMVLHGFVLEMIEFSGSIMPWVSQLWSFLAFTVEATSVVIDGIPGIEESAGLLSPSKEFMISNLLSWLIWITVSIKWLAIPLLLLLIAISGWSIDPTVLRK